jgi:hypothetical protein
VKRNQVADWSCSADSLSAFSLHRASSGRSENHVFSDGDSHRPVRSVNHAIVAPLVCTARAMVSNAAAASQIQMGNWSRSSYQRKKKRWFRSTERTGAEMKWLRATDRAGPLFFFGPLLPGTRRRLRASGESEGLRADMDWIEGVFFHFDPSNFFSHK